MENTDYKADRTSWGAGPWEAEPEDRVDFLHAGFSCFIKRGPLGGWCGYVGVPSTHPAYGVDYDDVPVEVHGGLTYANRCAGAICHVPQPGMPDDVWWLGFDTGHHFDLQPGMARFQSGYPEVDGTYRTSEYAANEVRKLADQLHLLGD